MIVIQPTAQVIRMTVDPDEAIEAAARECYQSEPRGKTGDLIRSVLFPRGHWAMLEFADLHMRFVTERGITHELVRHRVCSFAQESTRYVGYNKAKFDRQLHVMRPPGLGEEQYAEWLSAMGSAETAYMRLTAQGASPQIARSVLPTCTKAAIHVKANFREWLHIFKMRLDRAAHPQMRELMRLAWREIEGTSVVWDLFRESNPELFEGV